MAIDYRRLALEAIERAVAKSGPERDALVEEALRLNRRARAADAEPVEAVRPEAPGDSDEPAP